MMSNLDFHVPSTYQLTKCCKGFSLLKYLFIYGKFIIIYIDMDELGKEVDLRQDSTWNANSQLKFIQVTFSLENKTLFFSFILIGCKYVFSIYITVFAFKLINLFNAYILLFLHILILFY